MCPDDDHVLEEVQGQSARQERLMQLTRENPDRQAEEQRASHEYFIGKLREHSESVNSNLQDLSNQRLEQEKVIKELRETTQRQAEEISVMRTQLERVIQLLEAER